jgi:enoyl-CoA hydratase/carnithine racemase
MAPNSKASDYETIRVNQEGPALVIEMTRPEKLNAISTTMIDEMIAALDAADADDSIRGVILAGQDRAFSTGADMNDSLNVKALPDVLRYSKHQRRLTSTIEALLKPVVAAINGYCLTGGLELAMVCDIRIAGDGAQFGITSSKIGSVAGLGGTQRLPRLIGPAHAKELLFTSDFIAAEQARDLGIVNRVVPAAEVMAEALALVDRFAERAPMSLALMKRAVNIGMNVDLESGLYFEGHCTAMTLTTEDRAEGWASFFEKRPPVFAGR